MELIKNLYQIAAIIFYMLLFGWIFCKIRNVILINKLNCVQLYKEVKKKVNTQRVSKCLFVSIIVLVIPIMLFMTCFFIFIIIGIFTLIIGILTLGGSLLSSGSSFYDNLLEIASININLLPYAEYIVSAFIYAALYAILIRAIYINIQVYKLLKSNNENNYGQITAENSTSTAAEQTRKYNLSLIRISIIIIIFIIIIKLPSSNVNNTPTVNLNDIVFQHSINNLPHSWYFFFNDKLYAVDISKAQLYSTDLSGNNKEIIASSDELRLAKFFITYNGEAYYYTSYNSSLKKVNLSTGEIKKVIGNEAIYLMPDTLNDEKILANYSYNTYDDAYMYGTLDLKTGLLSNTKKVTYTDKQPYFYNKENDKMYYINCLNGYTNIYENNKIICTIDYDNNYNHSSDLVFIQDNYMFAITGNKLIKFDLVNYSKIEEKEITDKFSLIYNFRNGGISETSLYPLFSANNSIYKFNTETLSFEKIINCDVKNGFVQKYDNYYIFQTRTQTIIFNDITQKYKIYNSVTYNVENNYIYLMTYSGDYYSQSSKNLDFKVEKLLINNIF